MHVSRRWGRRWNALSWPHALLDGCGGILQCPGGAEQCDSHMPLGAAKAPPAPYGGGPKRRRRGTWPCRVGCSVARISSGSLLGSFWTSFLDLPAIRSRPFCRAGDDAGCNARQSHDGQSRGTPREASAAPHGLDIGQSAQNTGCVAWRWWAQGLQFWRCLHCSRLGAGGRRISEAGASGALLLAVRFLHCSLLF